MSITPIYNINLKSISQADFDWLAFKGKKILIVNTASECGYTPQYAQLQELYENFSSQLEIIACPCNQFGNQEPGEDFEIENFCKTNYGAKFFISEKLNVMGENQHPLFNYLTKKENNGLDDFTVEWNFNKFLLDESGMLLKYYPSTIEPLNEEILKHFQ